MNYLNLLLTLLSYVPTIVSIVHNTNPGATQESKTQAASQLLTVATNIATSTLPAEQANIAAAAGAGAQAVLSATVAAVHAAGVAASGSPAPVPAGATTN